jgi:hypothetical protein
VFKEYPHRTEELKAGTETEIQPILSEALLRIQKTFIVYF